MEDVKEGMAMDRVRNIRKFCKRAWWIFLLGGIASVIFGILAFINPAVALAVLALYFAAWVLIDGLVNIFGAVRNRDQDGWVLVLLIGVLGTLVGGYALLNPPISMMAFMYLVSFMALLFGVLMISFGWQVRQEIKGEWMLFLIGGLSVLFGVLILIQPATAAISVVWMIATWATVTGVLRIVFAFFVKNLPENIGARLSAGR